MVTFAYDENGNRIQMDDTLGTHIYDYDQLNKMVSHQDPYFNTVGYEYDNNGNREFSTYPGNKPGVYFYDKLNRLTDVTDWLNNTTHYNYDEAGRLIGSANPNNTKVTYTYDEANRLIGGWFGF